MSKAQRLLFVFTCSAIFIVFLYASLQPPRTKPIRTDSYPKSIQSDLLKPIKTNSRFISWLSARVPVDRIPFITIGDSKYVHALRNFRDRLGQWGYDDDFVVICLDQCCADARGFHAYPYFVGESIAFVKFTINLDLTAHGYNFVFLDGDVYLTGAADPFEHMLPLSNDTWDIQFQIDHTGALDYNIGWYFAKATERTFEFFNRSYTKWIETNNWDQAVMNEVGQFMELEEHSLRVHHLNLSHYKNFMLEQWEDLFGQDQATQEFIRASTIIHYTCIEQNLKTYFGYYFGGFGDLDQYYSDPSPLLGTANISGMLDAVHAQVAYAAQLARKTGRTFIWPDTIDLLRKRYDDEQKKTILVRRKRQPGIGTISWESARQAGLPTVEGNFLANFKRVNPTHVEFETVYLNARTPIPTLVDKILNLSERQVAVIDFADFSTPVFEMEETQIEKEEEEVTDHFAETARWLEEREQAWLKSFEEGGHKEFCQEYLDKLKKCRNANDRLKCLDNCGD